MKRTLDGINDTTRSLNKQLFGRSVAEAAKKGAAEVTRARMIKRKMTKTEAEYRLRLVAIYGDQCVHFEAISFRLANGHRYTPDFVVLHDNGLTLYEVKGSYKLQSHSRARLAYDQARIEWSMWSWVWAQKQPDGSWMETR